MNDREKLENLKNRLHQMRTTIVPGWARPIQEVGCMAIEAEITELGRRLVARGLTIRAPRRVAS